MFKIFNLDVKGAVLTPQLISLFLNTFWVQMFRYIAKNDQHLLMIVKVRFAAENGDGAYRSLTPLRRVNYEDRTLYIEYVIDRLGILADSYTVEPISEIFIEYIEQQGKAADTDKNLKEAEYTVKSHTYNNYQLPLTMNPYDYGEVLSVSDIQHGQRYIVKNKSMIFQIDQISGAGDGDFINNVTILSSDITYADYSLPGSSTRFKREIGTMKVGKASLVRYTYYIDSSLGAGGEIVVKTKQLKAKPFNVVPLEKEIASSDCFMTVDIETVVIDVAGVRQHIPYLIYGYTVTAAGVKRAIHSYSDINPDTYSKEKVDALFTDFITQLLTDPNFANVKYVYAHNLSGFDGILFLNHLIKYSAASQAKPLVFKSKLMSITFKHKTVDKYKDDDGKWHKKEHTRTLIFKDSYLMLPVSLRKLAKAFDVETQKGHLPYGINDTTYKGFVPPFHLWSGISKEEYLLLRERIPGMGWSFKDEAKKYCLLDCICLYEIIMKYNQLFHSQFQLNIHGRLTLPSLAMAIYRSQFMPKNSLYQLLGQIEEDIRQSYTGGHVDVYKPHNMVASDGPRSVVETILLYYYDVASLYPYIMSIMKVAVGLPVSFEGDIRSVISDAFGFFYCKITTPNDLYAPILQRRVRTKDGIRTVAGLGSYEGWISSDEMDNATKYGYQFVIIRGYLFEGKVIFKDYVEKLYQLRQEYIKSHPMNLIAKLLMNSLYGKFAMKPEKTTVELHSIQTEKDRQAFEEFLAATGEKVEDFFLDRKSTRLNSSHSGESRMPSSA